MTEQNTPETQTEQKFTCIHCGITIEVTPFMGTNNRNHCPTCLWSKHVDETTGDRKSTCGGAMEPIGLTFKNATGGATGELMLIHECMECGKFNINRIAADDDIDAIKKVFENSLLPDIRSISNKLKQQNIHLATYKDSEEVHTQLFGKNS